MNTPTTPPQVDDIKQKAQKMYGVIREWLIAQYKSITVGRAQPTNIFSHWNNMFVGPHPTPQEFFASVERAIEAQQIPDVKMKRVDWREGGIFSAKREYLRVRRKKHAYDICGAPFANGFFVSSWLGELPSGIWIFISKIPVIGDFLEGIFRPITYYKIDTMNMFHSLMHGALMEAIDEMTEAKGMRKLSEDERKPIMRDFFQKHL